MPQGAPMYVMLSAITFRVTGPTWRKADEVKSKHKIVNTNNPIRTKAFFVFGFIFHS